MPLAGTWAVRESALPSLDLDASDGNVTAAADRVADWLEQTGGLRGKGSRTDE
jgi:hypothetical protein